MSQAAASRRRRPWWAWPAVAAVLGIEVIAGVAAAGTFTLSTVPADRAATTGPYLVMVGCGVALLVVAAVAAALGAVTWFLSLPLALAAVVLCAVGRPSGRPLAATTGRASP